MICIILPTYNRGNKCVNVIENIINQTYHNWDLLIIDDGSEDCHSKLITNYIEGKKNIEYYKNTKNLGFTKALNVGIQIFLSGKYEYMTWISDDNIYFDNYLENLYELKADFSHSAWEVNGEIRQTRYDNYKEIRNFQGLASFMWSKKAVSKIGLYNDQYRFASDVDYLYRTYLSVNNIKYSPVSGMEYIIHDDAGSIKSNNVMRQEHNQINSNFP